MPYSELVGWSKYLAHEPHNSTEIQLALIAQIANNSMGGKLKLDEALITSYKPPKQLKDSTITNEQVLAVFNGFK